VNSEFIDQTVMGVAVKLFISNEAVMQTVLETHHRPNCNVFRVHTVGPIQVNILH